MKQQKSWSLVVVSIFFVLLAGLLTGCGSRARVGELRTESRVVEVGDAESVRVEVNFGAGNLEVTGDAEKLLEADFNYNVARLKPEIKYRDGRLLVKQPGTTGFPVLSGITDFRNEWDLHLNDGLPMDLRVDIGAGVSDMELGGLSLTDLDVNLGAGESRIDLRGDYSTDLDVTIDVGAADLTVELPANVGVRVNVETGPVAVDALNMSKDGNVYTNDAYGESQVTLRIYLSAGIGTVYLVVDEDTAALDSAANVLFSSISR